MTAPDARQSDELREAIIGAMAGLPPDEWDGAREAERFRIVHGDQADRVLLVVTAWHEKAAEAQARARAAEAVRPFEKLFSGGPDTPCRTVYRTGTIEYGMECVEVPMAELRETFERAAALAADDRTDPA